MQSLSQPSDFPISHKWIMYTRLRTNQIILENAILYLLFAILIYTPVFGFLTTLPIRIWDESRLAINAYEMYKNGNLWITFFDGQPDLWNTKPPFLIWMQAALMHLLGVNEVAVRLPSAMACFITCLSIIIFMHRFFSSVWPGFIAVIVLISMHGYINTHATRTGDYDAMLTLFTTLYCLLFFAFLQSGKIIYLYGFFINLSLAFLTKSTASLLFLPGLAAYSIINGSFRHLIRNRHTWIAFIICLMPILGFYLIRESLNPGYLSAVVKNEWGGRFLSTIENHDHSSFYYFDNFIDFQLKEWYIFVPAGIVTGLLSNDKKLASLALFILVIVFAYFILISLSQTKLEWYDVPMYPFIAIFIAFFIWIVANILKNTSAVTDHLNSKLVPALLCFFICLGPYRNIVHKTYKPEEYAWDKEFYEIGYYLKKGIKAEVGLNHTKLLYDGYNAQIKFYIHILQDKGIDIQLSSWDDLHIGDIVIAHQQYVKGYIADHYKNIVLYTSGQINNYLILGRQ